MKTIMKLEDLQIESVTVAIQGKDYERKMAQLAEALLALLEPEQEDMKLNHGPKDNGPNVPEAA